MAQEDRGLIIRGMLLFTGIGVLVLVVLAILFWRPPAPETKHEVPTEYYITALVAPDIAGFPAGVPWASVYHLAQTMPSEPGWDIRYNAANTLARRGSPDVRWDLILEMLDEKQQLRNNRVRQKDGRDLFDEVAARGTTISALRALAAWHEKRTDKKAPIPSELREIYAQVDRLAQSPYLEVKDYAEKARATFER